MMNSMLSPVLTQERSLNVPFRTIRIFALPSHVTKERTSGVDFVRIIQPAKYLNGYKYKGYKFEVYTYDPIKDEKLDWLKVAQEYDIIFFNYTVNPWGFAAMGAMARHFGKPLVMDTDDYLHGVMPDNPAYVIYHKGSEHLINYVAICNEVDWMTTTNLYLKHAIAHETNKRYEHIKVFPNYIDLKNVYTYRCKFRNDEKIELLYHGSTTHHIDLASTEFEKGIDKIFKEYPNVTLKTVGAFLPRYRHKWGERYINAYGHQDVYTWIKEKMPGYMDEADLMVVPLDINSYTRCKSSIKFLESSSYKKPGVYQKIRQYEEIVKNGENGFLAETAEDWYRSIKKLIDNPAKRKEMGLSAFKTVEENWQIQDHISEYAAFFIGVLNDKA